jgi:hypothetical protein
MGNSAGEGCAARGRLFRVGNSATRVPVPASRPPGARCPVPGTRCPAPGHPLPAIGVPFIGLPFTGGVRSLNPHAVGIPITKYASRNTMSG